jgi:hypothetical protein
MEHCDFKKINQNTPIDVSFEWLSRSSFIDSLKCFMITDITLKKIILIDLNGRIVQEINPDSLLDQPGSICSNTNNEIFVHDYAKLKVFVFNDKFKLIRELANEKLVLSFDMIADDQTKTLFMSNYFGRSVTAWNMETSELKNEVAINAATFLQQKHDKLYVLSAIESEIFTQMAKREDNVEYNDNCVYILDKLSFQILKKLKIHTCLHPKGLFVDDLLNIYTIAYTIYDYNENPKFLFKFNQDGNFVQRVNLHVSFIFGMTIYQNRLLIYRGITNAHPTEIPIYLIEFETTPSLS